VPYRGSSLYALTVPADADAAKGTVLMHGGVRLLGGGVLCHDAGVCRSRLRGDRLRGAGAGGTRKDFHLFWDQEWEKPTGAVLDYFARDDATLYGISMGGYLCLRAAAFEPRIKRVVFSGGAVDYGEIPRRLRSG